MGRKNPKKRKIWFTDEIQLSLAETLGSMSETTESYLSGHFKALSKLARPLRLADRVQTSAMYPCRVFLTLTDCRLKISEKNWPKNLGLSTCHHCNPWYTTWSTNAQNIAISFE